MKGIKRAYRGLQEVPRDYKRSQEVTASYKWLTRRYRRLKGITRG